MSTAPALIGIDVARDSLEVANRSTGEHWQVANNPTNFATLLPRYGHSSRR